ncbi:MAG: DnaJ domain-containing protein [Propionicimonas sp.]|nr:DnaJ domain-containing protein [Propionicimonas sp.]
MGRSHYDVLGITPTASPALVRAAYRARIREAHPDAGGSADEAARVNEAYDVLADHNARLTYDQTIDQPEEVGADDSGTVSPPDDQPRATQVRPGTVPSVPLWQRGGTAKTLGIAGGAWLIAATAVGVFAAVHAGALDSPQPAVAGVLTAALPAGLGALVLARGKLWQMGAYLLGYGVVCASQSTSSYGILMLLITAAVSLTMRIALRRARKDAAVEAVAEFWAACAHPTLSGWFIARSQQDRQTCLVQLVDVSGEGRPDTSAMLWGHHVAGTYVIADMSSAPANVLMTITAAEMNLAKKPRR